MPTGHFDWKTVIYIYVCGKCRTQFMLPMVKSVTFTGACANEIIPNVNKAKEGGHVRIKDLSVQNRNKKRKKNGVNREFSPHRKCFRNIYIKPSLVSVE